MRREGRGKEEGKEEMVSPTFRAIGDDRWKKRKKGEREGDLLESQLTTSQIHSSGYSYCRRRRQPSILG